MCYYGNNIYFIDYGYVKHLVLKGEKKMSLRIFPLGILDIHAYTSFWIFKISNIIILNILDLLSKQHFS